jgi:DNA-dependent RNA polymerase auxiliary subunit epsilon
MERFQTRIDDGVLYVEGFEDDQWFEVGAMDAVVELVGGETYTIEYGDRQQVVSWLNTDEDGTITFDVRDTIDDVSFDREFVTNLTDTGLETGDDGYPKRTVFFADMMTEIWDSKGNLDYDPEEA